MTRLVLLLALACATALTPLFSQRSLPEERFYINIEPQINDENPNELVRFGFGLGYQFFPMLRIGYHHNHVAKFYNLSDSTTYTVGIPDGAELRYHYHSLIAEFVPVNTRWYEVMIPLEIAGGHSFFLFKDEKFRRKPLWLAEGSVQALFKPLATLGLGAGAGYRLPLSYDENIDFQGFFFNLKMRFYFDLSK